MKKNLNKQALSIGIVLILIIAVLAIAQDRATRGRSRVPVNSMGWREEIDLLKAEVDILKAQVAELQERELVSRSGQLALIEWQYGQLNANRIDAAGHTPERLFWVCDIDEPTGDKQILRDKYTDLADIFLSWMQAQMVALQP